MKLRFITILLTVMTVLTMTVQASSGNDDRTLSLLVDDAALLTAGEASELTAALEEISTRQELEVALITVPSLPDGYTAQSYADNIYDYYGYGWGDDDDGILLLLSMGEREWAVTTYGYGITAFPDSVIDLMMNDCLYYISDGAYFNGFSYFAQLCDEYITKAKNGVIEDPEADYGYSDNAYNDPYYGGYYGYDDPMSIIGGASGPTAITVARSNGIPFALPLSLIAGFLISGLIVGVWKSELKSVGKQSGASEYAKRDSLRVTLSRDLFLYRNVSRTRRQTQQNNRSGHGGMHSSGSSVHRSSSGRSHGGRSGRF